MSEICLFAGTSEGRRLAEYLKDRPVKVLACVATEYGETLVPRAENIEISAGRLDGEAMRALFEARRFNVVIDATHPFATVASRTISETCEATGLRYLRMNREAAEAAMEEQLTASIKAVLARAAEMEADFLQLTDDGVFPAGATWNILVRGRVLPPAGEEAQT